jgi:hypothetical protein
MIAEPKWRRMKTSCEYYEALLPLTGASATHSKADVLIPDG